MNETLGVEALYISVGERIEPWEDALLELAPLPGEDEPDPVVGVRYGVAQYVVGRQESMPSAAQESRYRTAARSVLRQLGDIEGLPEGWEERHKAAQFVINPELEQSTEPEASRDNHEMFSLLAELVQELQVERSDWSPSAACRDESPELFHPKLGKGRIPNGIDYKDYLRGRLARAVNCCQVCPVQQNCFEYGSSQAELLQGYRIFGGRIFMPKHGKNPRKGQIINLLT